MNQQPPHLQKKIGIMGPFGFGNLGDAAIQEAMIGRIRASVPGAEIYGFSLNPEDTQQRHGIPSYPIGRMASYGWDGPARGDEPESLAEKLARRARYHPNPWIRKPGQVIFGLPAEVLSVFKASAQLRSFDLFIVSGGGQLDDYWGGPWIHPYSLLVWALIARFRRARLVFASVGAGPIKDRLSQIFIRWALSLACYRSFRDEESKRLMASLGFDRDDPVYPDLAHSLFIPEGQASNERSGARPVVGIGPMAYFDGRNWPEHNPVIYEGYLRKLAAFISWLARKRYQILFFTGEAIHDRLVIQDLKSILAREGACIQEGDLLEAPIEAVADLIGQLARTDLVLASRFHGVLLAQLLNKPVLALSYHPKVDALMADTGQSDYCLPIGQFEVSTLIDRFLALEANCEQVKRKIAMRTREYQAALDEQYDRIFQYL